jgi:hypothetical protein
MHNDDSRNNDDPEIDESDSANEPQDPAVEWVHEGMRLRTAEMDVYNSELAKLVDELGIDFVCQHACHEAAEGGERCPEGHCEFYDEYLCACGECVHQYIEDFVGFPIEE